MSVKGFLDINIGDEVKYANELAAYNLAQEFLKACGDQYGLDPTAEANVLDEDSKQMLLEGIESDPKWKSRGPASAEKPPPILAGRLVVELFAAEVPKAAENFRCLLTGERGLGKASRKPLHFKGTRFHRIVKGFVCQGGDVVKGDGSGGDSIYGGAFHDEKKGLALKHPGPGVLAMANSGRNSNTSQFFFTLAAAPQCDGKHVVFGKVIDGLEILRRVDEEAASTDGTPRTPVSIADCGVLKA